jgi:hypothetical protein
MRVDFQHRKNGPFRAIPSKRTAATSLTSDLSANPPPTGFVVPVAAGGLDFAKAAEVTSHKSDGE